MINKDVKTKYVKTSLWFMELIIWFLLILLLYSPFYFYKKNVYIKYPTYQIFIQDADGIIVGTPVKLMGVTVGYVKKIKIVEDMVYVDFIITEKDLYLPKGSSVTVDGTGLGGSKAIQISMPTEKPTKYTENIIVVQPMRIKKVLSLLNDMFDKAERITYRFSYFGASLEDSKINTIKKEERIDNVSYKLDDLNNKMDAVQQFLDKRNAKRNEKKK